MISKTILFSTISAANKTYQTLQRMIDVTIDYNAITYSRSVEETVKWLIEDNYCGVRARERIYPSLVRAIAIHRLLETHQLPPQNAWQLPASCRDTSS